MASLSVNESFATKPKNSIGETYTRKVLSDWKGNHVADACIAATQIGLIHSSSLLGYERSKEILREEFDFRKVDDVNWSVVNEAFQNGRSAVISPTEIRKRFSFAVANDNKPKPTSGLAALNTIRERAGSTVADQIANRAKERFQITWFDDVDQSAAKEEILQGVLGAGEFSLFVAKPGTAKSVLVGDIGCHIAAGMDWHGRKVKQGLVVFYAAERKRLTERRVAAWRKKHDVTNIPFVVIGGKLDMTTGLIDAKTLAATIKGLEEKSGRKCVLIILDTVTRTFGPGDQHQSRDMQRYVQSVDELTRGTGAHIAAIHHSPWSDDRGKGAIDLDGAIDVSFVVNVVGTGLAKVFTLSCTGANDGEDGPVTSFRLESIALGTDADGNVTTAPVVVQADPAKSDGSNLKGQTTKALESLERAIEEHGECPPDGSRGFPDGVVTVTREQWRAQFYADTRAREDKVTEDTLRKRFNRAILDLTGKQIRAMGEWFWLA
jgi:AAA domain